MLVVVVCVVTVVVGTVWLLVAVLLGGVFGVTIVVGVVWLVDAVLLGGLVGVYVG